VAGRELNANRLARERFAREHADRAQHRQAA
jgi:hypothetical protein